MLTMRTSMTACNILVFFAIINIILIGCSRSTGEKQVDEAVLRVEQVKSLYQAIPDIMDMLESSARKERDAGNDADLALLRHSATGAFNVPKMLARVRGDLAAAGHADADMSAFIAATDAFLQAEAAVRTESNIDLDPLADRSMAAQSQPPETQRIENLARAMAAAELQSELALFGRRFLEAAFLRQAPDPSSWRNLDESGRKSYAQRFVQRTRSEGDIGHSPPRDEVTRLLAEQRQMVILLRLSEPALKALEDFYMSETGKAKRATLVHAFAAQNDADTEQMMIEYLRQLR